MKPPGRNYGHAWKITTIRMATALNPSISDRYEIEWEGLLLIVDDWFSLF